MRGICSLVILILGFSSQYVVAQGADDANDPLNPQRYIPNTSYAYAGFGVYMAVVAGCLAWSIRYRAVYMIVLILSASLYAVGIMLRTVFAKDPHNITKFVAMRLMTLIPAGGFFVLVYVLFVQLVLHLQAVDLLPLNPKIIAVMYIIMETVCIAVQSAGAGFSPSSSASNQSLAKTLSLVGFAAQLALVATFTAVYILFVYRFRKLQPEEWKVRPYGRFKHFTIIVYNLGFAYQGLLIRTAYRLLEAAQGPDGKLARSELWFYMLDALQLLNVILGFVIFWPPYYLRPAMQIRLENPSHIELQGSPHSRKSASPERAYREA
ncbi:hypothetical protein FRC09_003079 [Ceratobasidium sp. 395]|nr:hypothetical protein FRC09_003079 [Ceratobasidium sp. 395]